ARSCGTLASPLVLGAEAALLLPIAAWRAAHAGATADYIVAGALAFTALLSGSRAAWAGLLVAVPVSLWGALPHWPETAGGLVTILLVAGVGRREHLSRAGRSRERRVGKGTGQRGAQLVLAISR